MSEPGGVEGHWKGGLVLVRSVVKYLNEMIDLIASTTVNADFKFLVSVL